MRPEEFKTYLSGTVLLTRSQISALKAMCDREIATRDELIVQRMAEQRS